MTNPYREPGEVSEEVGIRVIKPGHTRFYGRCGNCGCEFAYGLEDLKPASLGGDYLRCPTCNKHYRHRGA